MRPIAVTGSRGLIGTALCSALAARGIATVGIDLRGVGRERGDVREVDDVARVIDGTAGVVHLAAVSRVIDGERDPETCQQTNIGGLRNVLARVEREPDLPWIVFASSREVYGQATAQPVTEDAPLAPLNIYGRTKVMGEEMIAAAHARGVRASVVRLSNVYGRTNDHVDRVVPAFARAAIAAGELAVEGTHHTFDFTHLDDTIDALVAIVEALQAGQPALPPLHLVTGVPTTLGQLARLAVELAATDATIVERPSRTFDVSSFYGDPTRARQLLGWAARVPLRDGVARLIADLRATST